MDGIFSNDKLYDDSYMLNIEETDNLSTNLVIRGSYNEKIIYNYDFNPFIPLSLYTNYKKQIYKKYVDEKNELNKKLISYDKMNKKLIEQIKHIERKCNLMNIKHSNTSNFIIKNYKQLSEMISDYINLYNKNIYDINMIIEQMNCIDMNIEFMKYKSI
jgi:hypothetical protein